MRKYLSSYVKLFLPLYIISISTYYTYVGHRTTLKDDLHSWGAQRWKWRCFKAFLHKPAVDMTHTHDEEYLFLHPLLMFQSFKSVFQTKVKVKKKLRCTFVMKLWNCGSSLACQPAESFMKTQKESQWLMTDVSWSQVKNKCRPRLRHIRSYLYVQASLVWSTTRFWKKINLCAATLAESHLNV